MAACAVTWLAVGCGGASELPYTVLLTNVAPGALTVDDANVIWWNYQNVGDGLVERVPKSEIDASHVEVLGPGTQPAGAGGAVFTTTADDTSVTLLRYTGPGQVTTMATVAGYGRFVAADGDNVYFEAFEFGSEITTIWAQPLDGTPLRMVTQDAHGQPYALVIDGGELFWSVDATRSTLAEAGVGSRLVKVSTAGGSAQVVHAAPFMINPLAVDASGIFFFVNDDAQFLTSSQTLFSTDRNGGALVQLASLARDGYFEGANALATDGNDLYWPTLSDRIQRMPKTGGPIATLTTVQSLKTLALDADAIYFSAWNGTSAAASNGTLMRMPKPVR